MARSVLIVDSDPETSGMISTSTKIMGLKPCLVNSGNKALTFAQIVKPTLAFLKNGQRNLDVVDVLKQLNGYSHELPVYVMTRFHADAMDRLHEARRNGLVFELAALPLSQEQLEAIIEENAPLE